MKIIFLDFDGVLNNPGCYAQASGERVPADPNAVAAINHLIEKTGAIVVVSSTWRYMGIMHCRENLNRWGVNGDVIGVTPRLEHVNRGAEIDKWLKDYEREAVDSFVIIDDDADMEPHMERLVRTNGRVGMTMADAERAIALLGATA